MLNHKQFEFVTKALMEKVKSLLSEKCLTEQDVGTELDRLTSVVITYVETLQELREAWEMQDAQTACIEGWAIVLADLQEQKARKEES
jgi:hypothetical protein